jgi:hypothetical protein
MGEYPKYPLPLLDLLKIADSYTSAFRPVNSGQIQ